MLKYITVAFAFLLMLLDFVAYRKIVRMNARKSIRRLFISSVSVINMVPLSILLMLLFPGSENNGTLMMKAAMVMITLFIVLTLCRMLLYIFWLPTRNIKWIYCGGVVSIIALVLFSYSVFVTRTNYSVNEIELKFSNLPENFVGYRITFISDIHVGSMYNAEYELDKLSKVVSDTNSDILLFGGDLVNMHHSELTSDILEKLSLIKGKNGTYAVLGNHDTGAYLKDSITTPRCVNKNRVEDKLNGIGWVLLRDSTVFLCKGSDSISITGIDYTDELLAFKHKFDNITDYDISRIYSGVDSNLFNITVSHLPQLWYKICDNGYSDLTLAGHIHAMQLKYRILGFDLSPAALLYNEWSGLYEHEKGKLYINDGIGTVGFFARLGARPEITVIELSNN